MRVLSIKVNGIGGYIKPFTDTLEDPKRFYQLLKKVLKASQYLFNQFLLSQRVWERRYYDIESEGIRELEAGEPNPRRRFVRQRFFFIFMLIYFL